MKRFILILLCLVLLCATVSCKDKNAMTPEGACAYAENREVQGRELHHVEMEIKGYGTVTLLLDATTAPVTVANFLKLAEEGFYDGLTFHRVIKGLIMQGGDPQGNGYGGSSEKIYGEFAANGWPNDIKHIRGVISMARSQNYNSASSQFFIIQADAFPSWDGQYAAFGYVINGMNIIDAVCNDVGAKAVDGNGTIMPNDQPVIKSVRVID